MQCNAMQEEEEEELSQVLLRVSPYGLGGGWWSYKTRKLKPET